MNFEKIERAGHVLYMCLDSLPDPSVATAIGAVALGEWFSPAQWAGMALVIGATAVGVWVGRQKLSPVPAPTTAPPGSP